MAATRLLMRRLREILRLRYEAGFTQRAIADACRIGLGTVSTYLQRAEAAGLTWPLADDLDDAALEARLFVRPAWPAPSDRALPDWRQLHLELKKPGVTLMLLWQEYRAAHPPATPTANSASGIAWARWPSMRRYCAGKLLSISAAAPRRSDDGRRGPRRVVRGVLGED